MTSPPSFKQKILGSGEAVSAAVTRLPRPRVFTNGCFDLLHLGHVSYLEAARRLGAALIVGINTDRSVRLLQKGPERPINPLRDRAAVIAALAAVDLVVAFDEATPLRLIQEVMPDILVKGGDWALSDIVGADWVKQQGGDVKTIACEFERSTTSLIAKLRRGG